MLDPGTGDRYILSSGGQTFHVTRGGMALYTKHGNLRISYITRNPPRHWAVEDMVIEGSKWYHIIATWSKDGDLAVYLNGNLHNQVGPNTATMKAASASSLMYVAKPNNYNGACGEVCLDEWLFWLRALSVEEVNTVKGLQS